MASEKDHYNERHQHARQAVQEATRLTKRRGKLRISVIMARRQPPPRHSGGTRR